MANLARWHIGVLLLPTTLCGCTRSVEIAEVEGTVRFQGKPLSGLSVSFLPDPDKSEGIKARRSIARTDAAGHYILSYQGEPTKPGAAVGWHRVLVEDADAENQRDGKPRQPRIAAIYASAKDTPLLFEVKAGRQEIDLELTIAP
jgi:hypothetical protein